MNPTIPKTDLIRVLTLPRAELGVGADVRIEVPGDASAVVARLADLMADAIRRSNAADRPCTLIVPVGPVGQYGPLLGAIVTERLDCSRLTLVSMDEFLGPDGRWIDPDHPLSFRRFLRRRFLDLLPTSAGFRLENWIVPDPERPEALAGELARRGGVDACFGGIGLNGHLAFNEPEPIDPLDFARLPARRIRLAPESRAHMAVNLSCIPAIVPEHAVTIGMAEILAARALVFAANRPWQRGVIRLALHGPIGPHCPASYLRTHAVATLLVAAEVAEPVELELK